jgi:hypothetical protein
MILPTALQIHTPRLRIRPVQEAAEKVIGSCLMFAFDESSQRAEFGCGLDREF